MSADVLTPKYNNRNDRYIEICQAVDCTRLATEQIEVNVGKYGFKLLKVCNQCISLFIIAKPTNIHSQIRSSNQGQ